MKYTTIVNNTQFEVEILKDGAVTVNGKTYDVDFLSLQESLYSMIQNSKSYEIAIEEERGAYELLLNGRLYEAMVLDQRALLMAQRKGGLTAGSGEVNSPMPGLIVDVLVSVGDKVTQGDTVVILESMKMQNELKAPRDGVVQTVNAAAGQSVEKGNLLINIVEDEA
ncbi:MAG: acetyl-CoA carboxylase biotin carboxyl carrier protein subunit [Phototrophicaceae bacterium]